MTELSSLHSQAKRLIVGLKDGLERLEGIESGLRNGDATVLAQNLNTQLSQLQRISGDLDSQWRMQAARENATKRDMWKRKVGDVVEEVTALRTALSRYETRAEARAREAAERQELLAGAEVGRQAAAQLDAEAQMASSADRSGRYLEEMLEVGGSILGQLAGNRDRLKRAHRRVLDVINSVGMGESMLRIAERRNRTDALLVMGGMVVMTLFTIWLLFWR